MTLEEFVKSNKTNSGGGDVIMMSSGLSELGIELFKCVKGVQNLSCWKGLIKVATELHYGRSRTQCFWTVC